MFWTALCLSLSGSPRLHQCLQKVNKAEQAGGAERACEKTCLVAVSAVSTDSLGMHLFLEVLAIPVTGCRQGF